MLHPRSRLFPEVGDVLAHFLSEGADLPVCLLLEGSDRSYNNVEVLACLLPVIFSALVYLLL